jgi:signal transduction histidine kinase
LFRQGDPGDRVYAIWSGRVRVQYEMGTGVPPLVIGDRGPGSLVGEMALLEDAPRSATIQVVEDARLVSLSREDFERLLTEPKISRDVLRNLSQRLRASDEQLIEASRSVEFLAKRIAGVPGKARSASDTASSAQAQQWDGLNALFRHLSESTEDLMSGLRLLRVRLPDSVDEETEDLLSLLRGSGRRLTSHLSRIRDWQQLEGGTLKIETQLLDVKDLAEQVITKLTPSAKMLQLNLKLDASPRAPNVRGDAKWLSVALTEIIQNAINHAPPNSDINVNIDEPAWGKLRVAVADAGPGVPVDYRELIFEPFVRAPGAQGGGLGLGLSLARTIAQAHGGELRAEPGPRDQGAVFVLDLPALSDTVAELKGSA